MGIYRHLPIEVEAIQFKDDNFEEVQEFCGFTHTGATRLSIRAFVLLEPGDDVFDDEDVVAMVWDKLHSTWVGVKKDQWIIQGVRGELYPCDPKVFSETYAEVLDTPEEEKTFHSELQHLINKYSMENGSNTPDFILARYLEETLKCWAFAIQARDAWYGISTDIKFDSDNPTS